MEIFGVKTNLGVDAAVFATMYFLRKLLLPFATKLLTGMLIYFASQEAKKYIQNHILRHRKLSRS